LEKYATFVQFFMEHQIKWKSIFTFQSDGGNELIISARQEGRLKMYLEMMNKTKNSMQIEAHQSIINTLDGATFWDYVHQNEHGQNPYLCNKLLGWLSIIITCPSSQLNLITTHLPQMISLSTIRCM
jgi:hypothetical protein